MNGDDKKEPRNVALDDTMPLPLADPVDSAPRRKRRITMRVPTDDVPRPIAQAAPPPKKVDGEDAVLLDSLDVELVGDLEELEADELVEDEPAAGTAESIELEVIPPPSPPAPPPPQPRSAASAAVAAAAAAALAPPQRKKKSRAWFEEIFDEDYLRTLPFLTPKTTQREAVFLVDALKVQPGAQVLDLGCGYGRHAMELAARGFYVTALDLSLPLLLRGADEAQRRGLVINFVHGDMRDMSFDAQFDGAYCVFSTFGFFDEDANKKVIGGLARSLRPGGRVVLDVLNRDYVIADAPTRVWWEGDGCVVLEEVEFNYFASRVVSSRSIVFEDGRQVEQEISIRAYALHELGKMLNSAGFKVLEVSGGLAARGRFFGSHSRQIILVAEKRAESLKDAGSPTDPISRG